MRQRDADDHLEFTERCPDTHLVIIRQDRPLPVVEQVIRLSVIVPFFNVERYAAENLASLAQNATSDTEFILVDDGSTDATSSILADGAEQVPGAQLVRLRGIQAFSLFSTPLVRR